LALAPGGERGQIASVRYAPGQVKTSIGFAFLVFSIFAFAIAGCSTYALRYSGHQPASASAPRYAPLGGSSTTVASWYGPGFNGRRTSSGEIFNERGFTAASRTLPIGTYARILNLENGESVIVKVNDRGPYVRGRGLDLSEGAAQRLGLTHEGIARVQVTRLDTTAAAIPDPPERWTGRARVRRRYYHHSRYRYYRNSHYRRSHIIPNPAGSWFLQLMH